MILNIKLELQTEKSKILYEFGTHVRDLTSNKYIKLNLTNDEILTLKANIKTELEKALGSVFKNLEGLNKEVSNEKDS